MTDKKTDPNAALLGFDEDEGTEEEKIFKQLFAKNPRRVSALHDLLFENMAETIEAEDIPLEAKLALIFKMSINSVLDIIMECTPNDIAEEMTYSLDSYIGLAITNKKYDVDLLREHGKALLSIDANKFDSKEQYQLALQAFEEDWWSISQPLLNKRTPNDAISESMRKYGLLE
ncbi:MAG TPA: hypothetical protein VJX93_02210 [Candidatus Methanomethylophilaceae archaeon]|nr:hypothetical protein [Candidatus Methanomethylophilaceae archaeon]